MIFVNTILPAWAETLGWTLVHSLWQAALVMLLTILTLRITPMRLAKTRYTIACASLLSIIVCTLATFLYLRPNNSSTHLQEISYITSSAASENVSVPKEDTATLAAVVSKILNTIDQHMALVLMLWGVGALLFSMRLVTGAWYIARLKSQSQLLNTTSLTHLQTLARRMGIEKTVLLAESARITIPMVVGFFKPLILVPAGMLAGLSTAQIETILLHELAHIRRHDYLVNLAQVFVETIFFFNPFVWILSNIIRREREYCCDDEVVSLHGSSITYAHALAQLEELKLTRSTFALNLAANKNQLFNRIKRIMEKTGQNYSVKDRFIPAVLLIVGLVCASWLTVQNTKNPQASPNVLSQDTTIKKGKTSTTIITFDDEGNAHEQFFDEANRESEDVFAWAVPPVPGIPSIPSIPGVAAVPPFPGFPADVWYGNTRTLDSIPGMWFGKTRDWEKFSKEFEKEFSEKFNDFYKNHEVEFDKMMQEMEHKFKADFDAQGFHDFHFPEGIELEELASLEALAADHAHLAEIEADQAHALASLAEVHAADVMPAMELLDANLAGLQAGLADMEMQMKKFEKELQKMLVDDGYLKKDEEVKNINWSNESIEVNGKKIKESDRERYQKFHNKYFKDNAILNRIE